jgi:F0F1-type ATP synthase beta subunit
MAEATGRVVQILGGVVDVEFSEGDIPELFEAIEVERSGQEPLVLEVQKHIGHHWVRTVAMDALMVCSEEYRRRRLGHRLWSVNLPPWGYLQCAWQASG